MSWVEVWATVVAIVVIFLAGMFAGASEWECADTGDRLATIAWIVGPIAIFLPIFGRAWGWW